jgi:hypothetical protein
MHVSVWALPVATDRTQQDCGAHCREQECRQVTQAENFVHATCHTWQLVRGHLPVLRLMLRIYGGEFFMPDYPIWEYTIRAKL